MTGPIELIRSAAADAERAEMLYQDASFRTELREGKDVFHTFKVTTLPAEGGRGQRQMPASWRLRLDPLRARPLL
jgi:hypothetical protein